MLDKNDLRWQAYYAGLFDGEGSVSVVRYSDRHGKDRYRLIARISQVKREVLDNLIVLLNCGSVHAKKDKRAAEKGWQVCHDITFSDRSAREFLSWIEPFLVVKKDKVTQILDEFGRDIERRHKGRKNALHI